MKNTGNFASDSNNGGVPNKKVRHIVSWSQEEDDMLREQIRLHGTENWIVIASKFKDKTTRQCRRRWFSYLNSDFKKGGWSPEEDMLLCEAQRLFGNRWTEIAKVVSGRTDNAVKNRFTTLCKKRAKREALAKESNDTSSYIDLYSKRVIFSNRINAVDGGSETVPRPLKRLRTCIANQEEKISGDSGAVDRMLSHSFAVQAHNVHSPKFPEQFLICKEATAVDKSESIKAQGTFLKKDDPKVIALMQQAELLSSLAAKVNSEKKTNQSLESAWMALQNHMDLNKESGPVEELSSCNEGSLPLWRESDMYESSSPTSSEYSTGSTVLVPCYKPEESQTQICVIKQNTVPKLQENQLEVKQCLAQESRICISTNREDDVLLENNPVLPDFAHAEAEFNSPLHVTPMFRALAAAIPSPKFSESEKHFLMRTLGMESPSSAQRTDPSRPPLCKRSLLHCL